MAIPQRRAPHFPRRDKRKPKKSSGGDVRRDQGLRRRRFVFFVVVPVLLMLGSIYLHTMSAGLESRVSELQGQRAELGAQKERLEIDVSRASSPERVRSLARENGLRTPATGDLKVYKAEDGTQDARQQIQEGSR